MNKDILEISDQYALTLKLHFIIFNQSAKKHRIRTF